MMTHRVGQEGYQLGSNPCKLLIDGTPHIITEFLGNLIDIHLVGVLVVVVVVMVIYNRKTAARR